LIRAIEAAREHKFDEEDDGQPEPAVCVLLLAGVATFTASAETHKRSRQAQTTRVERFESTKSVISNKLDAKPRVYFKNYSMLGRACTGPHAGSMSRQYCADQRSSNVWVRGHDSVANALAPLVWVKRTYSLAMSSGERHHDISTLGEHESNASLSQASEAVQFCSSGLSRMRSPAPYTGSAGIAYALWRAGGLLRNHDWQQQAQELAASALRRGAHLEDASLLDGESANITYCNMSRSNHGREWLTRITQSLRLSSTLVECACSTRREERPPPSPGTNAPHCCIEIQTDQVPHSAECKRIPIVSISCCSTWTMFGYATTLCN
jgi:hypothetical protein